MYPELGTTVNTTTLKRNMRSSNLITPIELDSSRTLVAKRIPMNGTPHDTAPAPSSNKTTTLLVGFDWGTNKTCVQTGAAGSNEVLRKTVVPTVVGYAKEGIVENVLPGNAKVLFGQDALKHRLHLKVVQPMIDGVIHDLPSARDFAKHIRSLLDAPEGTEVRTVLGLPANADASAHEALRQAVTGIFDKVIMIPEPFLAALGYRDESRLSDPDYVDPVCNSLFIDIGGGTTDLCMIQGYYPTADDQISLPFAGDRVDGLLDEAIKRTYPDVAMSMHKVREVKEKHSYVGAPTSDAEVSVMVAGKMRKFELTSQVGEACKELLMKIFEAVKILVARASSDSAAELLRNIIITGGGSRIRNLDTELQRLLAEEGYENPRVQTVGENYKEFVAKGALKAARQAKDGQWQQLIS